MRTWSFWHRAIERAIKATAYGLVAAATGTYMVPGYSGLHGVLYTAAATGMLSLAGSLLSTRVGDPTDPAALPLPGGPPKPPPDTRPPPDPTDPPADTQTSANPAP